MFPGFKIGVRKTNIGLLQLPNFQIFGLVVWVTVCLLKCLVVTFNISFRAGAI